MKILGGEADQKLSGAAATIVHLEPMIAELRQDKFGASSERGNKLLDQMELQLEQLQATQSDEASASEIERPDLASRRKPMRGARPEHLPLERVVVPAPKPARAVAALAWPNSARVSQRHWR
jgi:hypothetical protein